MKNLVIGMLAVAAVLIYSPSEAAKCKYQWDTVNYRTGEAVKWTRWVMNRAFYSEGGVRGYVSGVTEGDRKYLGVQLFDDDRDVSARPTKDDINAAMLIPRGSIISLLMADDSTQELVTEEAVVGETRFTTNGTASYTLHSRAILKLPLSSESFSALSSQGVKSLRLQWSDRQIELSFGSKPSDKIQKALACTG